jgi:hypothetical protein
MNVNEISNQSRPQSVDALVQDALDPNPADLDSQDLENLKMARDPVCGRLISKVGAKDTLAAPTNDSEEGLLYFDSPECKALYEADPSKSGSGF